MVMLSEEEYYTAIEQAAALHFISRRIYDALLLCCAAKVKSETIYTWNLKHFRAISPAMAGRIRTP